MDYPRDAPPHTATHRILEDFVSKASRYITDAPERSVFPSKEDIAGLQALDLPLQDAPMDPVEVLSLMEGAGAPATVASSGSRYFGFVVGGSLPAALGASLLATVWDQNALLHVSSPVAAAVERVASRWLLSVLGLPAGSGTGFVTGATMANFTALAAARHALLAKVGWDVERDGLFGAPPITVIVGDEVHVSLLKGLGLLGLGRNRLLRVKADAQGRIRPDCLPHLTGPTLLCLQAGNVNTGAFDPIEEICEKVADAHNVWVHVDAAFGLWAAASPKLSPLTKGIERADSWAADAHKWLNVPHDSGLVFVRNPDHLTAAMATHAAYLIEEGTREPCHYVPELSRRARGLEIWAALKSLGKKGLSDLVEMNCRQARRFAEGIRQAGYSVLNEVVLNQVLVSFGSPKLTETVIRRVQEEGTCWCGGTVWQGHRAMRISVSSWRTSDQDVERSLHAILRIARDVS
jgi:glutamate/tyrosine decarboxylase-like PLP-dependent enzyme